MTIHAEAFTIRISSSFRVSVYICLLLVGILCLYDGMELWEVGKGRGKVCEFVIRIYMLNQPRFTIHEFNIGLMLIYLLPSSHLCRRPRSATIAVLLCTVKA
jgi:hypothetical protein